MRQMSDWMELGGLRQAVPSEQIFADEQHFVPVAVASWRHRNTDKGTENNNPGFEIVI